MAASCYHCIIGCFNHRLVVLAAGSAALCGLFGIEDKAVEKVISQSKSTELFICEGVSSLCATLVVYLKGI